MTQFEQAYLHGFGAVTPPTEAAATAKTAEAVKKKGPRMLGAFIAILVVAFYGAAYLEKMNKEKEKS